jgi:hypothetical protein
MSPNRRQFLAGTIAGATVSETRGLGLAAQNSKAIQCRITDEPSGSALAARMRLTDARGNDIVPLGHPSDLAPDAQQGDVYFRLVGEICGSPIRSNGRRKLGSRHLRTRCGIARLQLFAGS